MRNPLQRTAQPDVETLYLRRQAATLRGELHSARATIARLTAERDALRIELAQAQRNYVFMSAMYRDNPPKEGKHQ